MTQTTVLSASKKLFTFPEVRVSLFLAVFILMSCRLAGQDRRTFLTAANADCSGIIDLLAGDTVFGPTIAPVGSGGVLEISGDKTSLYSFEKEHNTVWYRFRVPYDCSMTFEVIPVSTEDDYDFILYRFSGKNFCSEVSSGAIKPVRTCISRNDPAQNSMTGLKAGTADDFVHSGPGPSFVNALEVKKGEVFVLVVDNVYPGGKGHTLKIHYPKPAAVVTQQQQTQVDEKSSLSVTIVDKETGELLKASARILDKKEKNAPPVGAFDSVTSFTISLGSSKSFLLKIEAQGYFDYSREVKTSAVMENLNIRAELDKIVVGKNVVFENILFYGDEARFLPESTPALENLAGTMNKNPNLKIEIQGHVNCPLAWESCQTRKMEDFNMALSVARAKAVFDYLVESGTDPSRMTYAGYGATKMIYPDARSEEKMEKNRRVEIGILSN